MNENENQTEGEMAADALFALGVILFMVLVASIKP